MDIGYIIKQLEYHEQVFYALWSKVPSSLQKWKPIPGSWSLLEIVCHMIDEEKVDFRTRVAQALEHSDEQPPAIDPESWVEERRYLDQDYELKVEEWVKERKMSINWLDAMRDADWSQAWIHPKLGPRSARHFLANWLAHDYLHIRQSIRIKFEYLKQSGGEDLDYAGNW